VPVVDAMHVLAAQSRDGLDELARVAKLEDVGEEAHLNLVPDQTRGHRVRALHDLDRRPLAHLDEMTRVLGQTTRR
jgi:hypothetical protein